MYTVLKEGRLLVKLESYGGQHLEDCQSGRVISKNDLDGQKSYNVQEVQM